MEHPNALLAACIDNLHRPAAGTVVKASPADERWILVCRLGELRVMVPHAVAITPGTEVTLAVRNIDVRPGRVTALGEVVSDDLLTLITPSQVAELDAMIDARIDALNGADGEHVMFTLDAVDDAFLGLQDHGDVHLLGRRLAEAERWRQRAVARAVDRWVTPGKGGAEARFERMVTTLVRLGFSSSGRYGPITLNGSRPAFRPMPDDPEMVSFGWGPMPVTIVAGELLHRALFRAGLWAMWDHDAMAAIDVFGLLDTST